MSSQPDVTLGNRFIDALVAKDFDALQACLHAEVAFRALTPPGVREAASATEVRAYFQRWFGDCTEIVPIRVESIPIGERLHIAYRLDVVEEGKAYTVEQQAYCTLKGEAIAGLDLLCSGFETR
ncbi:MAG: nuclear transport factor 2 family protein [Armatimonadetes bacterium]|nr:nuclear transport factor 2 family protein [Armatimonadota bacterium]